MGRSRSLPRPPLAVDRLRLHGELRDLFALAALATRDFARERDLRALAVAGIVTPAFALAAALFDAAENIVWLLVLGGHGGKVGPPIATTCAALKFLLIGLAIVYVLLGPRQPRSSKNANRALAGSSLSDHASVTPARFGCTNAGGHLCADLLVRVSEGRSSGGLEARG